MGLSFCNWKNGNFMFQFVLGGVMNNKVMMIATLTLLSVLYSKQIFGEYLYQYSDAETIIEAKQKCMLLAKKDAVEKYATFIKSETVVRNYITEKDELIANTESMLADIKIIEENIDKLNSKIYYKISAEVDESKILAVFEQKEKMRLDLLESEKKAKEQEFEAERIKREQEIKLKDIEIAKKEELEKLRIEAEKRKIAQEENIRNLEAENLLKQKFAQKDNPKRKFWAKQKWISLGVFAASVGVGSYFQLEAESYYADHENATSTQSAIDAFDDATDYRNYGNITYSVSLVPLGYFFYSWYKESKY